MLVKTLLLSQAPSNRIWLSEQEDYLPQLQNGDVMRGLVIGRIGQILPEMEQWLLDGKIQYRNTEVSGLENAQQALPRLFSGTNTGKLVIKVD